MTALNGRERAIYELLQDDKSREVFTVRKEFADAGGVNSTNEDMFFRCFEKADGFDEMIQRLTDSPYVIYGAGITSRKIITALKIMNKLTNCVEIWDKNEKLHGEYIQNIQISAPKKWGQFAQIDRPLNILVGLSEKNEVFSEVIELIHNLGYDDAQIIHPYYLFLNKAQYFDSKIILPRLTDREIFVDGGSWDFSDGKKILQYAPGVKKIYAFEPEKELFEKVERGIIESGFSNVQFEKCAMWSEDTSLFFVSNANEAVSHINDSQTNLSVPARALDNLVPADETVTFIKMDIEGAELEALKGCSDVIRRDKPKLAICAYHKPYDYLEIPEYILSLVPEYKLFFRHYRLTDFETVLYAVI